MINWNVAVLLQEFLTSAANSGFWLDSRPGRFIPDVRPAGRHHISGWANPSTFMNVAEKNSFRESKPQYPDQSAYSSEYTDRCSKYNNSNSNNANIHYEQTGPGNWRRQW